MRHRTEANSATAPHRRAIASVALLLLGIPLATACAGMLKTSVNIPLADDYDEIVGLLYQYVHTHGPLARIEWVLTASHSEYKLILLNAAVALQYHLIGHTNFRALQLLGDLSVPATLLLLSLLLARQRRPFQQAIWLILVPWYLFLSLCYFETVNWATCGLQELAVIPLSVASVFFFTSTVRHATLWGTLFLTLSIAAFGSGFTLALALLLLLIFQRRRRAALAVALTACVMFGIYHVHRTHLPGTPLPPPGGFLAFLFAFLGGLLPTVPLSIAFGVFLLAGFLFLLTRGWVRLSPDTFCLALFCLITAAVVARGRYILGVETAMSSRYRMYPLLLVSAEYLAALRILVPQRLQLRSLWAAPIGFAAFAAVWFGITSQMHAYRLLHARQRALTAHLILWERHPERLVLVPDGAGFLYGDAWIPFRVRAQEDLQQSIAAGLYIPPVTAQDPLPVKPHTDSTRGIEDESWPPPPAGAVSKHPGSS